MYHSLGQKMYKKNYRYYVDKMYDTSNSDLSADERPEPVMVRRKKKKSVASATVSKPMENSDEPLAENDNTNPSVGEINFTNDILTSTDEGLNGGTIELVSDFADDVVEVSEDERFSKDLDATGDDLNLHLSENESVKTTSIDAGESETITPVPEDENVDQGSGDIMYICIFLYFLTLVPIT